MNDPLEPHLKQWKVDPAVPGDFNARVWQRIALRENQETSFFAFWTGLFGMREVVVALAIIMLLSGGVAGWMASQQHHAHEAMIEDFYVRHIDPYSRLLAMEEVP